MAAARIYVEHTKSKLTADEVAQWLQQKDAKGRPINAYSPAPSRSLMLADYMYKDKLLAGKPDSWKDYFWDNLYSLPGS